jgi:hypothetical protein
VGTRFWLGGFAVLGSVFRLQIDLQDHLIQKGSKIKMIAEEQEIEERRTLLVANDLDGVVRIWSAQSRYITELRHNANFTEIKSGHIDDTDTEWVEFSIPATDWNPATGAK